jgi:hypothetical protein
MVESGEFAGYRVERVLGEGGMARVFRAYDPRTDRCVALKVLKGAWREDAALVERFLDEAKKNGPLNHPNIVRVHRIEATPQPFIDMELVDGPTLGDHLRARGGRLPADEAGRIGRDLASALHHAHRLGRVHRDVKPGNVMMADDGRTPKLVDFGIAVIDGPEATRLTQHGEMIGTPRYMAPEQVRGERVDGRTDLFALGSVLYELLAGRPAVEGDSLVTVTNRIVTETPPALRQLAPGTPPALAAAVERLMAKDPAARFADAGEARTALEEAMSQSSRGARGERGSESGGGAALPPPRRAAARWVVPVAALAVIAILGGVGYLLLTPPALPPQPPVVAPDTADTTAGAPVTIPVLANDRSADGQPLRITAAAVAPRGQGTVRVEGDVLVYDPGPASAGPAAGQTATVALTYEASDAAGARGEGQVTVTVRGDPAAPTGTPTANRPPLVQDVEHVMSAADRQAAIPLDQLAGDPDGNALTFSAPSAPRDGPGDVAISGDLLLFTPGAGFADLPRGQERTVTVPVTARDPGGLESRADVRITVTGVAEPAPGQPAPPPASPSPAVANRPPEAGDLNEATAADAPLSVELTTLARDPDGDPLLFSAPPAPVEGVGSVAVDGDLLLFDPGPGFADLPRDQERTVTVPVTARDPAGLEAHANLRVTVTGVGLPPPPEPDLRAAMAKADQLIRSEPCARLEMEANGGEPRVLMAASDSSLEPRVAEVLRQGAAPPPDVRFAALPGGAVACGVFDLINATTTPEPARFVQLQASVDGACDRPDRDRCYSGVERQVLAEGERLVLSVDPPAGTPYVVVDYFMTDGSVAHLYPPHAADDDLVAADRYAAPAPQGRVVVGDSRAGKDDPNEYPVGPPFGHELVVAVAAAAPLFDEGRPFVEPAGDYLPVLERALASPPGGMTPKAAALWLETVADHR